MVSLIKIRWSMLPAVIDSIHTVVSVAVGRDGIDVDE